MHVFDSICAQVQAHANHCLPRGPATNNSWRIVEWHCFQATSSSIQCPGLFFCAERRIQGVVKDYDLSRIYLLTSKVGRTRLTFSSSPFVLMEHQQTLNSADACRAACRPTHYWLTTCATRALSAFPHLQEQKLFFFACLLCKSVEIEIIRLI